LGKQNAQQPKKSVSYHRYVFHQLLLELIQMCKTFNKIQMWKRSKNMTCLPFLPAAETQTYLDTFFWFCTFFVHFIICRYSSFCTWQG